MKVAVARSFVLAVLLFSGLVSFAQQKFPIGPNPTTTPGSLCTDSTQHRYAENIVYCVRNVSSDLKNQLIQTYDHQLGFQIEQMPRGDFKIDHFIPLSIGGSNNPDNLWPQHKSVYTKTDPLELLVFQKISNAHITQAEAVRVIREAKLNLDRVPELIDYVQGL